MTWNDATSPSLRMISQTCKLAHGALLECLNKEDIKDEVDWICKIQDVYLNVIKRSTLFIEGKELISFIDMLEACYQDLKMIRYENEFTNTTVTSLIESKLPKDVRREWAKEIDKRDTTVTDENKFERLLEFLKELRRIVEYDLSDVRSHDVETPRMKNIQTQQWRLVHNTERHSSEHCNVYQGKSIEERLNLVRERNACWSCLRVGHRINECWFKQRCGIKNCDEEHHEPLHSVHAAGYTHHSSCLQDGRNSSNVCLLPIMSIKASLSESMLNVLFDG